jgi:DNA-binding XRE family transcriptional regulator
MTASISPNIVEGQSPAAASATARVIFVDVFRPKDIPTPPDFDDIDAVVARSDADVYRQKYLEAARRQIATELAPQVAGLSTLRLRRGWSQKRLADEIGTSQSHIARMELGREDILLSTARRLAKALDVTIEEIDAAIRVRSEARARP